jgi:hypothetical protein
MEDNETKIYFRHKKVHDLNKIKISIDKEGLLALWAKLPSRLKTIEHNKTSKKRYNIKTRQKTSADMVKQRTITS